MAAGRASRPPRIAIPAGANSEAALAEIAARRPGTLELGRWGDPLANPPGIKRLAALVNSIELDLVVESADSRVLELARREGLIARSAIPAIWRLSAPVGRSYALLTGSGPYWRRSRRELILGGPLLLSAILAAILVAWLLVLFPSARVEIEVERVDRRLELTAYANPSFSSVNARQKLLPGRIISAHAQGTTSGTGTGQRRIGVGSAAGAILVTNLTEQILQIPRGTVLEGDNGRRYFLDSGFALPTQAQLRGLAETDDPTDGSQFEFGQFQPVPTQDGPTPLEQALEGVEILPAYPTGSTDVGPLAAITDAGAMRVRVTAERSGSDSNLAPGAGLRAIGPYGSLLQFALREPLTGGSDSVEALVTEAERQAALTELQGRLRTEAEAALSAQLRAGEYGQVLPGSELRPSFTTLYSTTRGADGGLEFEYEVDLELQATVFERADLEQLAELELTGAGSDPASYRMLPGTLAVEEPRLAVTLGNTVAISYSAAARIERLIDPRSVRDHIAGMGFAEAFEYVNSIDGVARSDLRIWSPFGDAVTWVTPRIEVEIAASG